MEQNKSFDPNEPVTGQTYDPNTQMNNQGTQPVVTNTQPTAPYVQPAAPYVQPAAPYVQPAVQNIQTETQSERSESHPARRIVGVLFGAVEIILGLRLIMKLLGANAENELVKILYSVTGFFVSLFEGIFSRITINEASGAVFEPATLLAMVVIALLAWVVLKLMTPRAGRHVVKTEYSGPAGQNGQRK